jgi:hypothetical protein
MPCRKSRANRCGRDCAVYLGLGDREATFAWLEQAYEAHATALVSALHLSRRDPVVLRPAEADGTLLQDSKRKSAGGLLV